MIRPKSRASALSQFPIDRRSLLRGAVALGGAVALAGCATPSGGSDVFEARNRTGGRIMVRWLGGGIVELATPDYKQIDYCDAWIWDNTGWDRFNLKKPAEYASKEGFAAYVASKRPEAVFVLLTHDHGDHMGDYFEMLKALVDAGVPVKTTGQSDLMRNGLVSDFRNAGLDPAKVVVNGGAGMNFGGVSRHGAMAAHLVPAIHSNLHGYPAAGYMLDIGGLRVYLSGDTDLFPDMKTLGRRYQPDVGFFCVGGGPFTMDPADAAKACAWMGVSRAVPVHYAHNPLVMGVQAGDAFSHEVAKLAPSVQVSVLKPGELQAIAV